MNEQEKSLRLAELRGVELVDSMCSSNGLLWAREANSADAWQGWWEPYSDSDEGRAQFAAILLKFPEVMARFVEVDVSSDGSDFVRLRYKPTQACILDAVLVINGVEL